MSELVTKTEIMKYLLLPTLLLAGLLYSCKGETTVEKSVVNFSSSPVRLQVSNPDNLLMDTLLQPGERIVIGNSVEGEGYPEPFDPSTDITYFVMYNQNNDTCTRDYTDPLMWYSLSERTKKTPANYNHRYNFVVTDADF